ncbi:MAG: ABC transporter substrate-binding protein [Lachnospiraceae bacterium]|nr:ABC transporter substrate-binding protein [Lachnospiraceae bacterium]
MKKVNKLIASLLVGSMVLSLAACGNPEGTGNTDVASSEVTSNEASSEAVESTEATPAEVVKPESIKVMWDGTVFKEGDNYAEEFYAALDEALGMKIEWVRPDHSSYAEQVGIAFNDANTLADVVILPANYYASYASQGNLWNMTDAWLNSETANSGRLTDAAAQVIEGWYVPGPDGQEGIYGMYPARGNGCITYVKAAWATAAGYTEDTLPTTWAEYQDFLLAMKEATGKAPVLAAGLVTQEAPYTNYLPEFYQDAYPEFYQNADGQWVDGFSEQAMIDALDRLAWGYSNGVLEASILEGPSTSDVRNKFYDDTTGIFTYWAGTWAYNIKSNLEKKDVDSEVWNLKPIAELGTYIERLSPMIAITSSCENPEGVFKYFIDTMLDGGEVQMLWQYGVENVHYQWNEDGATITGLPTQSSAGSEKESLTSKNLFEANLKLANFAEVDPYVPADAVIDESFELFNATSSQAVEINSSEVYRSYSADLWTIKNQLIADVTQGKMTGAEAIAQYNEECGDIVAAILDSFNN